jgi:glycosyltransferase involved in cell wall biosynthesis
VSAQNLLDRDYDGADQGMTKQRRDVSVIIPTAGRRPLELARAIESVRSQTIADQVELVVVDDSADGMDHARIRAAASPMPTTIIRSQDRSVGQRSLGVRRSVGNWIAFLDDDDLWLPRKLEMQRELARDLESSGQLAVVSCRSRHTFVSSNRQTNPTPARLISPGIRVDRYLFLRRQLSPERSCIYTSTLFVSGQLCREVEWRRLARHQDWDWILRAGRRNDVAFAHHPQALALIRVGSAGSISADSDWQASLAWAREAFHEGMLDDATYAEFLTGQTLRYALNSRSGAGVVRVFTELRRIRRIPTVSTLAVGMAGIAPRRFFQRAMSFRSLHAVLGLDRFKHSPRARLSRVAANKAGE